jgi:hypothetical protein
MTEIFDRVTLVNYVKDIILEFDMFASCCGFETDFRNNALQSNLHHFLYVVDHAVIIRPRCVFDCHQLDIT